MATSVMAPLLLMLAARATAAAGGPSVLIEAHCDNALRVRISPPGTAIQKSLLGALAESCATQPAGGGALSLNGFGTVSNGNIEATATASTGLTVTRVSDGVKLLSGPLPSFNAAPCGAGFFLVGANFSTVGAPRAATAGGDRWYGLGQLGAADSKGMRNCKDNSSRASYHGDTVTACVVPLERSQLGPVTITSVKYWIAIPWLFNRNHGWGVFFNQPGQGVTDVSRPGTLAVEFECQKQLDMWVTAAPVPGATTAAAAVYSSYAAATGLPSPLPDNAALYWQSRDQYKDQAEVLALASNFSKRNLSVGVIVIDLGVPSAPPYFRLDPARFPDVPGMAKQVKELTGADLMPNIKPTSVKSADCPACGAGHQTDGHADDGNVDASSAACRACIWEKRLQPQLYSKGVKTFWCAPISL